MFLTIRVCIHKDSNEFVLLFIHLFTRYCRHKPCALVRGKRPADSVICIQLTQTLKMVS